jgi:hypothetical protein
MTTIIGRVSNPRGSSMRHSHNPLYSTGKSRKGHGKGKGKSKGRKRNPGMMHRLMNPGGIDIQKVLITTGIVAGASYASELVTDAINENVFEANGMTGAPRALANIAMGALAIFGGMYADAKMKGPISYTCVGIAFAANPIADGLSELLGGGDDDVVLDVAPAVAAGYVPGMRGYVPGMTGHSGHVYSQDIGTHAHNQHAMSGYATMSQLGLDPLPQVFAHPTSMQGGISRMQGDISRMQGTRAGMC